MMGRIPAYAAALFLASGIAFASQPTSQSWELRGRDWQQLEAPGQSAPSDPELDRIEQLVTRGSGKAAFKEAVRWLKANPQSSQRDRGLMLAMRALYLSGDRIKAFYYGDELLDTFPESPYYQPALELQYQIADAYLSGYKQRVLGLPIGDATDEGIEMMFRIQQRSPGSQLAERALLRTADYYYANADYDLAGDAYAAYARSYPRSPEVPEVRLRQAWSYLAQFRDPRFDATPVVDARAQLTELLQTNPELAQQENVPALIERIDSSLAQKLNITASLYRRTGKPESAAYLYGLVLREYPNTPEADVARRALDQLPPVEPPPADGTSPTASAK